MNKDDRKALSEMDSKAYFEMQRERDSEPVVVLTESSHDGPIMRVSVVRTSHFRIKKEPLLAVSLYKHLAVEEEDGTRTAYFREEDLELFLTHLRQAKKG